MNKTGSACDVFVQESELSFTTLATQVSNVVVEQYNLVHFTHALLENDALYDVCCLTSTSSARPTRTQPPRQFARRSQLRSA